jgi:hypothetical protein
MSEVACIGSHFFIGAACQCVITPSAIPPWRPEPLGFRHELETGSCKHHKKGNYLNS